MDIDGIISNACGKFRASMLKLKLDPSETWAMEFEQSIMPAFQKVITDAIKESIRESKVSTGGAGESSESMGKPWYGNDDPFPFGKYGPPPKGNGQTFGQVPSSYFDWLITQDWVQKWEGVVRYINGETPPPSVGGENPFGSTPDDESEVPF